MTHRIALLGSCALSIGVALFAGLAVPRPVQSANQHPEVFRTTCVACHSMKGGQMPVLDGIRATPEEWDNILRRMGRRGFAVEADERKRIVKEISRYQSLTPEENAAVAYLGVSPAANLLEEVPDVGRFRDSCVTCHSYGKIASYRRNTQNWQALKDFHLGMFPIVLTQSYRDLPWWDEAAKSTAYLAKALPFDTPEWRAFQAKREQLKADGSWVLVGHDAGMGDYEALMTLTHQGNQEYKLQRQVTRANGEKENVQGSATLYGGGALRAEWQQGNQTVHASYTLNFPGKGLLGRDAELVGAWTGKRANHHYGQETGARLSQRGGALLKLSPAWVRPGQGRVDVHVMVSGPVAATWQPRPSDPGVRLLQKKQIDATHWVWTLDVGPKAKTGKLTFGLKKGPDEQLTVAPRVDYIKVTPERAIARIGGVAIPPDGVVYEAMGYSNGPDGKRHTDDDLPLGFVPATWSLAEYFKTTDDRDLHWVGTLSPNGVFMPGNEHEVEEAYNRQHTGNVWVIGSYQPSPDRPPLKGRGYLSITVPDVVKPIY